MADVVCAWCKRVLERGKPGLKGTSHGICEECERRYFEDGEDVEGNPTWAEETGEPYRYRSGGIWGYDCPECGEFYAGKVPKAGMCEDCEAEDDDYDDDDDDD